MTKYYFVSYSAQVSTGVSFSHAIVRITDTTLNELVDKIAKTNNYKRVIITSLKDLTKEEYEMLKDKEDD